MTTPTSVDAYIEGFGDDVRTILEKTRAAIHASVPGAEERISYAMPSIWLGDRYVLYFAAWKKHLGIYPVPRLDEQLEQRVAPYRRTRDTVGFPYAKPIPYDLITEVAAAIVRRPRR